jgi:hypothetical protein
MRSKNLQNITQASSVHLTFLLSSVPQLDSELSDLSLKALIIGLKLTVLFNDLVDSFGTLCSFSFDLIDSDVLFVEQVDKIVVCFGGSFHDDGVFDVCSFRYSTGETSEKELCLTKEEELGVIDV